MGRLTFKNKELDRLSHDRYSFRCFIKDVGKVTVWRLNWRGKDSWKVPLACLTAEQITETNFDHFGNPESCQPTPVTKLRIAVSILLEIAGSSPSPARQVPFLCESTGLRKFTEENFFHVVIMISTVTLNFSIKNHLFPAGSYRVIIELLPLRRERFRNIEGL